MNRTLLLACVASFAVAGIGCGSEISKKGTPNGSPNNQNNGNNSSNNQTNANNTSNNPITPTNNAQDPDGDGLVGADDNCPLVPNAGQTDVDGDGVGDACDNCIETANIQQDDTDGDGVGDACAEPDFYSSQRDRDGDGRVDIADNCHEVTNPDQSDSDGDGVGNACDNCPAVPNVEQGDEDGDGIGDACGASPAGLLCDVDVRSQSPDFWLLLDNSGSMASEESEYRAGIQGFLGQRGNDTRVGMSGQSSNLSCTDTLYLPLGSHSSAEFSAALGQYVATGPSTPNVGLSRVVTEDYLNDAGDPATDLREKLVVLMTDGPGNSCDTTGTAASQAATLAASGATVHVIGFDWDDAVNPATWLTDVASAGGGSVGRANDRTTLERELLRVRDTVLGGGCTYVLSDVPDPNRIWVSVGGTYVTEGSANGYLRNGPTIELIGSSCSLAEGGSTVDIVTGCAVECEPSPEACDYVDNSCDGVVDEGCIDCSPEVCNGVDDDCDEQVDEGCP